MIKARKVGILLIIIGIFIPSVFYPFTTLTRSASIMKIILASKGSLYKPALEDLKVVLVKGDWKKDNNDNGHYEGRITVPYGYIIALGITLVFFGIGLIALSLIKRFTNEKSIKDN